MNIVFIGDCDKNTGPSNVNKDFKRYLEKDIAFLKNKNKILRCFETIKLCLKANIIIISGLSVINNVALWCARITDKPVIYLMHGCYMYEAKINKYTFNERTEKKERSMLAYAKRIIAVSELYMNWVKKYFPEYNDKITFINNGIEWSNYDLTVDKMRDPYMVLAMGGGRPQKNNIVVCRAIQLLNEQYLMPFRFVVLGRDYADTEAIKKSPYTRYLGQVPKEELKEWIAKATIYIQNSSFEPFGLAPVEALCSGCNILVSKNVGAISIIGSIEKDDIIEECNNVKEIALKIMNVFKNPNNKRLLSGIDRETTSCQYTSMRLLDIAKETALLKTEK